MNKFTSHDVFTFPNLLSFLRIPLAFLFYYFYSWDTVTGVALSVVTLLVSALTDLLDGKIARHFNQVSDFGKVLDPIADKITQATFILCLFQHYPSTIPLFIFFVIKEVTIGIFALIAVKRSGVNQGALIYGKVNTVLLYICLGLLLFFVGMPTYLANLILDIAFISLLLSMTLYLIAYIRIILSHRGPKKTK